MDQKVDGIAVTLAKPDAMRSVLAKAEKAGIPWSGSTPVWRTGRSSA
ncbi:hypothetical protein SVIOM342S_01493 [Streptomyces violaceorubidus]